ncbi:MAG: glycosyltransferase family 4 protein [Deltaproteobacteria bacterium]|nr:glycosyltransferase family 4 protein [Deltaproteobacteria bacterium]
MKVNIAVCGKFHYHNYIRYLDRQDVLNRFFHSYRVSANARFLSVRKDRVVNIWIKEYLLGVHLLLFNDRCLDTLLPLYHDLWQAITLLRWRKCDIFQVMLHGTSRKLIQKAREEKAIVIGQPVNSHPQVVNAILNEEYQRLGNKKELKFSVVQKRLIQEIEMCDYLLVASRFIKDSFVIQGFDGEKIHVIPYGVDLDRFYPLVKDEKVDSDSIFRVICVASIIPRKGHVYLLEAWKRLNLPHSELLLIGGISTVMKPVLAKYTGWFRHIPHVPNVMLRQYYSRSSVFVLPSLEDGFAMACGEAMGCGLPVITTSNTGASEIIEHGKEGFIIPIRSPGAIAHYLDLLYRDQERLREMSVTSLDKSRTDMSWKAYAHKLCSFYNSLNTKHL